MKIKPLGHFVLIEVRKVEKATASGILLPDDLINKEQATTEFGVVIDIGPCAYVDWAGCTKPDIPAHIQWGIKIGDEIEFRKYEGKACGQPGYENFRYIPDKDIIGVITHE